MAAFCLPASAKTDGKIKTTFFKPSVPFLESFLASQESESFSRAFVGFRRG
ncbi:transcriptional regulator [Anopheles sinensis]|uniref:Transcriptional regulator n=1 Tax=Anopheles sinensis TaxID=74873 RepID=A0A084W3M9_ANOSI|nr:transcriptional regulator [Anopheles sinensis]